MSGFVAVVGNHADPERLAHLTRASQVMAYRGDQETLDVFSDRCAAATRFREQSGYRTDTYTDARLSSTA